MCYYFRTFYNRPFYDDLLHISQRHNPLAFGVMIGTGGSAIISAKLGEGKETEAKENFMLFCVAPLALLGMALQSFFIANGTPGLDMGFSVASGIVNIFLDWPLIAKVGLGTTGAAFAIGIGYSIPALFRIVYFFCKQERKSAFYRSEMER